MFCRLPRNAYFIYLSCLLLIQVIKLIKRWIWHYLCMTLFMFIIHIDDCIWTGKEKKKNTYHVQIFYWFLFVSMSRVACCSRLKTKTNQNETNLCLPLICFLCYFTLFGNTYAVTVRKFFEVCLVRLTLFCPCHNTYSVLYIFFLLVI